MTAPFSSAEPAGDAYALALADPAFLDRVTAQYLGRHAVLDALWWRTRPLETAPSGAVSPRSGLRALRTAVYSQPGPGSTPERDATALAALEAELAADTRAIEEAVAAALAPEPAPELPGPEPDPEQPEPGSEGGSSVTPRGRGRLIVGLLAAAMVLAFIAGAAVSRGIASPESSSNGSPPNSAPNSVSSSAVSNSAAGGSEGLLQTGSPVAPAPALAIFDSPAQASDADVETARHVLGGAVVPASIRQLSYRVEPGANFFAARDPNGRVCLIAVIDGSRFVASCSTDAAFARTSLRLEFLLPRLRIYQTDAKGAAQDVTAEWTPDGIARGAVVVRAG